MQAAHLQLIYILVSKQNNNPWCNKNHDISLIILCYYVHAAS
jgi:hypothetical protein